MKGAVLIIGSLLWEDEKNSLNQEQGKIPGHPCQQESGDVEVPTNAIDPLPALLNSFSHIFPSDLDPYW